MSENVKPFVPSDRRIEVPDCKLNQIFVTVLIPPTFFPSAYVINRTARIKFESCQTTKQKDTVKNLNSHGVEYSIRAEYVDPECPWQKLTENFDPRETNVKKFDPERFDEFVREWLNVLKKKDIEGMLEEKSNLTLVISPDEGMKVS
jgi:hypothetical protein